MWVVRGGGKLEQSEDLRTWGGHGQKPKKVIKSKVPTKMMGKKAIQHNQNERQGEREGGGSKGWTDR